jgi:quercetin dioxygenase-like cupin family protein
VSAPGQHPVHVPADGGESVFLVGDTYTTLLSGTQTGGVFTLLEALVLPEAGPPPHAHHGEEETFFLLQGHMVFTVGGEAYDAHPGSAIYVPRNVAHSYQNVGEGPAKMLFMYSPAGMEAMFPEIGKLGSRGVIGPPLSESDLAAMASVAQKYRFSFIAP